MIFLRRPTLLIALPAALACAAGAAGGPALPDCGQPITAPGAFPGDTCLETDDCALRPSRDAQFEVTLPADGLWTFSVCEANWDTWLALGTECCTVGGGGTWFNDDAPGCGTASVLTLQLPAGTYFLTLEGFNQSACGPFTLQIFMECAVICDPGAILEGEPPCGPGYVDQHNPGCNAPFNPIFQPVACGDIICGASGTFTAGPSNLRDTDWYEIELAQPSELTLTCTAEFDVLTMIIFAGSGDCQDFQVLAIGLGGPCETVIRARDVVGGTYWLLITVDGFEGVACESVYEATVQCVPLGPPCPADVNADGVVNVLDLLAVLAAWGAAGGSEDINGDGTVNVLDLLEVLAAWGPCGGHP